MNARGIATLADVEAIEAGAPLPERLPASSVGAMLLAAADRAAHRPALTFVPEGRADAEARTWTHARLAATIRRWANALHALGVRDADGVAILAPNLPETCVALYGTGLRAAACPINPAQGVDTIAALLAAARCTVLVAPAPEVSTSTWRRAVEAVAACPSIRHLVVIGRADPGAEPVSFSPGASAVQALGLDGPPGCAIHAFDALCAAQPGDRLVFDPRTAPDAEIARFHTGGTTGAPKVARHTNLNHLHEAWAFAEVAALSEADVCLVGLPLFHVHAVIPATLAPLSRGAHVVLLGTDGYRHPPTIQGFWRHVERFGATVFSAVPTVLDALADVPVAGARIGSLRIAVCGSAPLAAARFEAFEAATGLRILEGYGLTEGTCVSSVNPLRGERRIGSIGLRLPYQRMKVARLDDRGRWTADCRPGETGSILISGPNVFAGYTDPAATDAAFAAPGWLDTGDLGRVDADGYFWISGRAKDLIKRSGHSVDPRRVEEVLHRHPEVAAAAVVGRPEPRAGEVPVAFVVARGGARPDPEVLLAHCRATLADPIAQPVALAVLDALPLTSVGKVDKVRLRALAAAGMPPHASTPMKEETR